MVWCVKFCRNFSEKYEDEIWSLDRDIEECISIIDSKKDKQCHFEGQKLMCLRKSKALFVKHLGKIEKYNKSLFNLLVFFYQKNLKLLNLSLMKGLGKVRITFLIVLQFIVEGIWQCLTTLLTGWIHVAYTGMNRN